MAKTLIVIPARMQATRLPGKPLADIAGAPMIEHVWRRAREADLGPVVVVQDLLNLLAHHARIAENTDPNHLSQISPVISRILSRSASHTAAERQRIKIVFSPATVPTIPAHPAWSTASHTP